MCGRERKLRLGNEADIKKKFILKKKLGGAVVKNFFTPAAACIVPEVLGGAPVTEIGDRCFAESPVEEVYLPGTLKRIGRYGFYNCERLRAIHIYAETMEIGGGIFNGCRNIREIFIHMRADEKSALRDFVTELGDRIIVHYFLPDGNGGEQEAARLVFPAYYDEAVENTPARITVSNIHGTGQKYRYCFTDRKLRFERYDKLFVYERVEESVTAAAEIAMFRLWYPYGLWEDAKKVYEDFLQKHLYEVLAGNLGKPDIFKRLFGEYAGKLLTEAETDRLILEASKRKLAEISGILMNYKHERFQPKKKRFEF